MKAKAVLKELSVIAGKVLGNTRGLSPQWFDKIEVVVESYGRAKVVEDFGNWCDEVLSNPPLYPISEYLKIVDNRLGSQKVEEKDPRVDEISALTYRLTHRPASARQVREALAQFSADEIKAALTEYVEGLDDRELAYASKAFFMDGGCAAIITARQLREQERLDKAAREKKENAAVDAQVAKLKEESDRKLAEIRAKAAEKKPTAEELFS